MLIPVVTVSLAGLTVLNIVLSLALIRRVRPLQAAAEELGAPPDKNLPRAGTRVREFTAGAIDGTPLTQEGLGAGPVLVGVVIPDCPWCERLHARLVADRPRLPLWVFVHGSAGDPAAEAVVRKFSAVAVRVAYAGDEVLQALGMSDAVAFPTLLRVDHGVIRAAGHRLPDVLSQRLDRT